MSAFDLTLRLFLQLAIIVAACRVVGAIGNRFDQTPVVSEMVAGVPNARGLMELMILNIGLEQGVITPTLSRSWCSCRS